MAMKPTVVKDLLCIMAFGTSGARNSAAKLLFYYWPPCNISAIEKRTPTHQVRLARKYETLCDCRYIIIYIYYNHNILCKGIQ
jgi:hypothetical protein